MVRLLALVSSTAGLISAAHAAAIPAGACPAPSPQAKAVFFQTNKSPNHIAAIAITEDGTLHSPNLISSGGNGGNIIKNEAPDAPDGLSSQDSVKVFKNFLFNVNAGSNSVSMFLIPEHDPTDLKLLGTAHTPGDFPNSLAVMENKLCVGHAGTKAGVSCADWLPGRIGHFDAMRSLPYTQSSPPNASLNVLADTFFSADGSAVFATVKGDSVNNGLLAKWPIQGGTVSSKVQTVSPNGTAVLFGADVIPNTSKVFIADATFGGVVVDLNKPQTPLVTTVVSGQKAICWARIDPSTGTGYLIDGGINRLTQVDLSSGAITSTFNSKNGNGGNLDVSILGSRLYALSPGSADTTAHVAVFGLSGEMSDMQNLAIPGTDINAQGLAVFA